MKMSMLLLAFLMAFMLPVSANESIDKEIVRETEIENATRIIPESVKESSDISFSPTATPSENGLNITDIFKHLINIVFKSLSEEIKFIISIIAIFTVLSIVNSFCEGVGKGTLEASVHFCTATIMCTLLLSHVSTALENATGYADELSVFVQGLLPFMSSISLIGGEVSTSAINHAIIITAVSLLQNVLLNIAIPISKIVLSFSLIGYIAGTPLGALSEYLSSFTTKLVTISFGILCAIIYFQNTVSTVSDSLALRSVKLAAGSFIPIVGGFVSEASGTLLSGIRLVKSTFGVFAICLLIYMGAIPIVNFGIKKVSLKLISIIAKFLNADKEAKVIGELIGIYNILSAIMIASLCFFIFAVSVFIKSEVG